MIVTPTASYEPVSDVRYVTKHVSGQPMDVLRIELEARSAYVDVPNGDFSTDNMALWALAHMGLSPSTMDETENCTVHVVQTDENSFDLSHAAAQHGKSELPDADWCPQHDDDAAPDAPSGAVTAVEPSKKDGGDPTA